MFNIVDRVAKRQILHLKATDKNDSCGRPVHAGTGGSIV
jgi:hypothetical protein